MDNLGNVHPPQDGFLLRRRQAVPETVVHQVSMPAVNVPIEGDVLLVLVQASSKNVGDAVLLTVDHPLLQCGWQFRPWYW